MKKEIDFKYGKKKFSNSLTYKLSMTVHLIFSVFCLTLVVLYVIGNFQNFQDKSQQIILNSLAYSAIFTALLSIFLIIETIIKIFTEKNKGRNIFNLIYLLLTIIFSAIYIVLSCSINYVSLGA